MRRLERLPRRRGLLVSEAAASEIAPSAALASSESSWTSCSVIACRRRRSVVMRVVRPQSLEAPMDPQVLLRHLANVRLDERIEACGVGHAIAAGEVLECRKDLHAITAPARHAFVKIRQHLGAGHLREP